MSMEDDLTSAAARGDRAAVEDLLRRGASVNGRNRFGRTALQVMMMGSSPVARLLLSHGADPNVADTSTGHTPLHDAARTGYLDTVRLLLEFQADPQAKDLAGHRPEDLAGKHGNTEVADFLRAL